MKNFQVGALNGGERVIMTKGKHKGLLGKIVRAFRGFGTEIEVMLDSVAPGDKAVPIETHYRNFELADGNGEPIIAPVTDMTGREITEGTWLVYSVGGGREKHGLELGRVDEVTEVGSVKVQRMLRDGEKVADMKWSWKRKEHRHVYDADRSLALPCDVVTMTEWVLKDFEDLKGAE